VAKINGISDSKLFKRQLAFLFVKSYSIKKERAMTDEELVAHLRNSKGWPTLGNAAADRIEALIIELADERKKRKMAEGLAGLSSADIDGHSAMIDLARNAIAERFEAEARAVRMEVALLEIAAGASVPVHTGKNGINFKKMYKGWRKIATKRIDIARAALVKLGEN
jgi:hypothetical protein